MCKCGSCGSEKQSLSEWERHTGSKGKNWKTSVRVKGSMMSLEQWVRVTLLFFLNANFVIFVVCLNMLIKCNYLWRSVLLYQ